MNSLGLCAFPCEACNSVSTSKHAVFSYLRYDNEICGINCINININNIILIVILMSYSPMGLKTDSLSLVCIQRQNIFRQYLAIAVLLVQFYCYKSVAIIVYHDANKYANKILYWYSYIDDILLLYSGNSRQAKQLHQHINKLHRKLNFALETEIKNSMDFLDLTITKTDNRHTFKYIQETHHHIICHTQYIKSPYPTQTCSIPFHGQQTSQRTLEPNWLQHRS